MNNIANLPTRLALAAALGTVALLAPAAPAAALSPEFPDPPVFEGAVTNELAEPYTQAGGHPFQIDTNIEFATTEDTVLHKQIPDGAVRNARVNLPDGLIGNPQAVPRCHEAELAIDRCPIDSQLGLVSISATDESHTGPYPLYNMVPAPGEPAELGFSIEGIVWVHLATSVRPDGGVTVTGEEISQFVPLAGVKTTIWGVPADPAHNAQRICHPEEKFGCGPGVSEEKAFLSLPTSCTGPQPWTLEANSWQQPNTAHASFEQPANTGCGALHFEPTLKARPTTDLADAPSGFEVDLHLPQGDLDNPSLQAQAHLKDSVITLPEGLVINPSSANGLGACSSAQIGLGKPGEPSCPDASKIGTVEVDTPLLDHPLPGAVYVAAPHDNPFGSLLAIYIVIDDPVTGVVVKLAGHVEADPSTGRLTTTVSGAPQVPFEDFKVNLRSGAAAPLRTPTLCANYSTTSALTPWSAPESGPPATPSDAYAIAHGPGGGGCSHSQSQEPDSPSFDAGNASPIAHAYTPFLLNLRREDGSQQFSSLSMTLPAGLAAKLIDTPRCPDQALAAAAAKSGAEEQASPSCPAASRVGSVIAAAGAGPAPYHAPGTAYLAGPYKGAPASLAVVTPAVAGPFDLGTIVVRSALNIDPTSGQVTAKTDPIPSILQGIPLDVRSIQLRVDKPNFTFNPSSCDEMGISGTLLTTFNQTAPLSNRFQAAECGALPFKPSLSLRLKGGTHRGDHPALSATLRLPQGGADIARVSVALPHSEFLDTTHIGTICTRVQFAAGTCPAASVYGQVKVFAPLFAAEPFEGPVYLRSSSNPLPDLLFALHGPPELPASLDLVGRIDSVHGGTRTSFESVPDLPFEKAVLTMQGGRKGLFVNSRDICATTNRATALFDGQNGKTHDIRPKLEAKCKGRGKHKHRKHGKR